LTKGGFGIRQQLEIARICQVAYHYLAIFCLIKSKFFIKKCLATTTKKPIIHK
jgi:hypothetical protein